MGIRKHDTPVALISTGQDNRLAIIEAKRRYYADFVQSIKMALLRVIRTGDHAAAWDAICLLPDEGRDTRTINGMAVNLTTDERLKINYDLKAFALLNGWNEAAAKDPLKLAFRELMDKAAGGVQRVDYDAQKTVDNCAR